MKIRQTKVWATILAASMLVASLAGCAPKDNTGTASGGTSSADPSSEASTSSQMTEQEADSALFPKGDLKGATIKMLNVAGGGDPNTEGMEELEKSDLEAKLKRMEEKYNCKYEWAHLAVEWAEIPNEVIKSVAAGQPLADFFEGSRMWLPQLAANDVVVDLTEVLKAKPYAETKYVENVSWLGKKYGIGTGVGGEGLIYNRKMIMDAGMEKTPSELFRDGKWGYDDFYNYCVELKSKLKKDEYPFYVAPYYWALFATAANGAELVKTDGTVNIASQPVIEVMEFLQKMVDANLVRPANVDDKGEPDYWGTPSATFDAGIEVAMAHRASWQAAGLVDKVDFGFVPYPWGPQVKVTGDYTTIPENYKTTFYDAGAKMMLKGAEKKGDLGIMLDMYMDLVEFAFIVKDAENLKKGEIYSNSAQGEPRWFNNDLDVELFDWSLSRERFEPVASVNSLTGTEKVMTDIINEKKAVRSSLEAQLQVAQAAMKDAGYVVE